MLLARVPVKNIGSAVGTIICGPPVNTSGFFDEVISIDLGPGERDIIPLLGAGEARGNPIEIGCGAGSTTDFLVRNAHLVVLSVDN